MKLALGTAQFGLRYGIANRAGQVSQLDVARILALAQEYEVDTLDTAASYGGSEACLGEVGIDGFRVVTKLPANIDGDIEAWVVQNLKKSLQRLRVDAVYGLLVHRSEQLLGSTGHSLAKALTKLKAEGLVSKIGVSIYDPEELDIVTRSCSVDLVQAPFNLFDRRLMASGWLQRLHDAGIEVHARSVFLQGLLLMQHHQIPEKFSQWSALLDQWHEWLAKGHATAVEACMAFVNHPMIDRVVIGVDSVAQFNEILQASTRLPAAELPSISCNDKLLINPSSWNSL